MKEKSEIKHSLQSSLRKNRLRICRGIQSLSLRRSISVATCIIGSIGERLHFVRVTSNVWMAAASLRSQPRSVRKKIIFLLNRGGPVALLNLRKREGRCIAHRRARLLMHRNMDNGWLKCGARVQAPRRRKKRNGGRSPRG